MVFQPFGNETTLPPAGWHPEPKVRGTFSILSTSLLTLFLCVYTVVHTNVPEYEEDRKRNSKTTFSRLAYRLIAPSRWRRFGWMVMAILAPELVAWNAFEQRCNVKRTTKAVRKYIGESWTDTHSWFALMGGYAFDIADAPEPFFPHGRRRLSITHHGIVEIARYWPQLLLKQPLTIDQIKDKSKADGLAKCIFRLSSSLTISLLELNVFGHAICALLIYILWWDKPQGVTEPHLLASEDTFQAAANLCTSSEVGRFSCHYHDTAEWAGSVTLSQSEPDASTIDVSGPVAIPFASFRSSSSQRGFILKVKVGDVCRVVKISTPYKQTHREAVLIDEFLFARLRYSYPDSGLAYLDYGSVAPRCRDWCIDVDDLDFEYSGRKAIYYSFAITLASAVYGGLHVVAFWAPFASSAQQLLWRMSSLTVAAFGAVFSTFMLAPYNVFEKSELFPQPLKRICRSPLVSWTGFVLLGLTLLWYLFCRTYLVVECFISLAYLSESQLAIPSWSLYIPHIS